MKPKKEKKKLEEKEPVTKEKRGGILKDRNKKLKGGIRNIHPGKTTAQKKPTIRKQDGAGENADGLGEKSTGEWAAT